MKRERNKKEMCRIFPLTTRKFMIIGALKKKKETYDLTIIHFNFYLYKSKDKWKIPQWLIKLFTHSIVYILGSISTKGLF